MAVVKNVRAVDCANDKMYSLQNYSPFRAQNLSEQLAIYILQKIFSIIFLCFKKTNILKDLGEIQPTRKWYSVKVLSLEHVSQSDCYMFIFHNFLREYSFQQPDNMSICHWPDIAIVTCTFHGIFFEMCHVRRYFNWVK